MKTFAICVLALAAATQVDALGCNYEGTVYPVCMNANAWSYENGRVCVGITRCVSQSPPYGIVQGTAPPKTTTPPPGTPTTTPKPPTSTPKPPTTTPKPGGTTVAPNGYKWGCADPCDESGDDYELCVGACGLP